MHPKYHIILGFLFSSLLYFLFPFIGFWGFLIIFLSSFLIDVDHYLYYVFKNKTLNIFKIHKNLLFIRKKYFPLTRKQRNDFPHIICFLHGFEVLAILFLLGIFVWNYFLFVFIGFLFHLVCDFISEMKYQDKITKISLIWDILRLKKN